ncbi:MAG: pilus assembly protein PilM [Parcubacteria group bacterium]|nr:pilus assembly protein PilM [Parcubacteria group bacterium]
MWLFSRKVRRQLGVDIGTSSIKVVELERQGKHLSLQNYSLIEGLDFFGSATVINANTPSTLKMSENDIAGILKQALDAAKIKTTSVIMSIPVFSSFLTVMEVPQMSVKELESAVPFEAKSYIPVPLSEVVLDWLIIPPRSAAAVPAAASKGSMSAAKIAPSPAPLLGNASAPVSPAGPVPSNRPSDGSIAKLSVALENPNNASPSASAIPGLTPSPTQVPSVSPTPAPAPVLTPSPGPAKPSKIEILLVAVPKEVVTKYQRIAEAAKVVLAGLESESFSLNRALVGNDPSTIMLIDFGARSANLTLIDRGFIYTSHTVDLSGKEITKVIAQSLNVAPQRAEDLKKSLGVGETSEHKGIAQVVSPFIDKLAGEAERMANLFLKKEGQKIEKAILTGGSANLPGLSEYLQHSLGVTTALGNPFARLKVDSSLQTVLKNDLSSALAVSAGAAMREL